MSNLLASDKLSSFSSASLPAQQQQQQQQLANAQEVQHNHAYREHATWNACLLWQRKHHCSSSVTAATFLCGSALLHSVTLRSVVSGPL